MIFINFPSFRRPRVADAMTSVALVGHAAALPEGAETLLASTDGQDVHRGQGYLLETTPLRDGSRPRYDFLDRLDSVIKAGHILLAVWDVAAGFRHLQSEAEIRMEALLRREAERRQEKLDAALRDALSNSTRQERQTAFRELCIQDGNHRACTENSTQAVYSPVGQWIPTGTTPLQAPELSKEQEDQVVAHILTRAAELRAERLASAPLSTTTKPTFAAAEDATRPEAAAPRPPDLRSTSPSTSTGTRSTSDRQSAAAGGSLGQRPPGWIRPHRQTDRPLRTAGWERPPEVPWRARGTLPATLTALHHLLRQLAEIRRKRESGPCRRQ